MLARAGVARPVGLALGLLADRLLGDPRRGHPVAGFGTAAGRLERLVWADARGRGVLFAAVSVGVPVLVSVPAERTSPRTRVLLTAVATWAVVGGRSLEREAHAVAALLEADDLPGARHRVRSLVGRQTEELSADDVARAAVESVAENTSDAVVAPLLWGAAAGVPGLVGYRAVNTLDAMVGHRTPRHARFGWAPARLDDLANLVPARVAATSAALAAPVVGGRPTAALRAWHRDASAHPSPNAGPVEAAFAGALDRRLGGTTIYASGVEHRPLLGDGPSPTTADVRRATRLALAVDLLALAVAMTSAGIVSRSRSRCSDRRRRRPAPRR